VQRWLQHSSAGIGTSRHLVCGGRQVHICVSYRTCTHPYSWPTHKADDTFLQCSFKIPFHSSYYQFAVTILLLDVQPEMIITDVTWYEQCFCKNKSAGTHSITEERYRYVLPDNRYITCTVAYRHKVPLDTEKSIE
jgi:hypothetical protein